MDLQEEWYGGMELDCSGSGQGQVADAFGSGNEPSSPIKCGEFLDLLRMS